MMQEPAAAGRVIGKEDMAVAAIHRTAGALVAIGAWLRVIENLLHAPPEAALK